MHPLTLINGVENYIQAYAATSKDKTLEKYTSVLRENVEELNGLIQEILDFPGKRKTLDSVIRTSEEYPYPLFCELNSNGFTHYPSNTKSNSRLMLPKSFIGIRIPSISRRS